MCGSHSRGHLVLRRVEEAWTQLEQRISKISKSIDAPIVADYSINAFNAYFGPRFEDAFLNTLRRTSRLRAASIGLALLYMSPRVEDLLISRLIERDLEVELIYQHPSASNENLIMHPDYLTTKGTESQTEDKDKSRNPTRSKELEQFLDRLFQIIDKNGRSEKPWIEETESAKEAQKSEKSGSGDGNGNGDAQSNEPFEVSRFQPPLVKEHLTLDELRKQYQGLSAALDAGLALDDRLESYRKEIQQMLADLHNRQRKLKERMNADIKLRIGFTKLFFFHSIILLDDDMFVFWYGHQQHMHREPVVHISRTTQTEIWTYFIEQYKQFSANLAKPQSSDSNNSSWYDLRTKVQGTKKHANAFADFLKSTAPNPGQENKKIDSGDN